MRPMSLAESGESTGGISLGKLFEGEFEPSRNKTGIMETWLGGVADRHARGITNERCGRWDNWGAD